jgi:DNA-binding transcriptional regulator YiaG
MTNLASILKSEIARVVRKEVRLETVGLKKSVAAYRAEIAALKRRSQALEKELRRVGQVAAKSAPATVKAPAPQKLRFSAKRLVAQRKRLGLSATDFGLLVGVSGQTIYNWEEGKSRPRAEHLLGIAALRSIGKKEAGLGLAALRKGQ